MKTPLEYIHHLRGKPVHVRERVAGLATVAIMGLIVLSWLGTAKRELSMVGNTSDPALDNTRADVSSLTTPIAALRDSFSALFSGFGSATPVPAAQK